MLPASIPVRFCVGISETDANDSPDYLFTLEHLLAVHRWNSSIEYADDFHVCHQNMRDNQTDLTITLAKFPSPDPLIGNLPPDREQAVKMISSFTPVSGGWHRERGDAMMAIASFSPSSILLTCCYLITFYVLMKSYSSIVRSFKLSLVNPAMRATFAAQDLKSQTASKVLTGVLLKQASSSCGGIERKKSSFRFIVLAFNVFVFLVHFFFNSSIKTDLIVTEKPSIIDSYSKLLQHPTARPVWFTFTQTYQLFRDSAPDSLEARVWSMAQKRNPGCREDDTKCLYAIGGEVASQVIQGISQQELVFIGQSYASNIFYLSMCPLAMTAGVNPMVQRSDKDGQEVLLSLIYNKRINEQVRSELFGRARRSMEAGFPGLLEKGKMSKRVAAIVPLAQIRACSEEQAVGRDEHPLIPQKSLTDFVYLSCVCMTGLFVASILLASSLLRPKLSSGCRRK